jgi:hypothetical protein
MHYFVSNSLQLYGVCDIISIENDYCIKNPLEFSHHLFWLSVIVSNMTLSDVKKNKREHNRRALGTGLDSTWTTHKGSIVLCNRKYKERRQDLAKIF